MKLNGLILAAGNSRRLGHPKQLVKHQNTSLLALTEQKLQPCCDQLYVVLGFNQNEIKAEIKTSQLIVNHDWEKGLGSSLACGAKIASQQSDGILIALVDQPLIPAKHYQKMKKMFLLNPDQIVSSDYNNNCGVPAIFPASLFTDLININHSHGARNIIRKNSDSNISIKCDEATFDIDEPADLSLLS